jgi:hypothetical protein
MQDPYHTPIALHDVYLDGLIRALVVIILRPRLELRLSEVATIREPAGRPLPPFAFWLFPRPLFFAAIRSADLYRPFFAFRRLL